MAENNFQRAVMEVSPWTKEKSFSGSAIWWDYILSKSERQRLESLIGMALLDPKVCQRLLKEHDDSILSAFDLSTETKDWLKMIHADTLSELAEAITNAIDAPIAVSLYPEAA